MFCSVHAHLESTFADTCAHVQNEKRTRRPGYRKVTNKESLRDYVRKGDLLSTVVYTIQSYDNDACHFLFVV